MKISDVLTGLIFMLAGSGIAIKAQSFPDVSGQPYGSTFFPTLIGIGMIVGGVLLGGNAVLQKKTRPLLVIPDWLRSTRGIGSFIVILVSLAFYMIFADRLGFCLTSFVLVMLLQIWMGGRWVAAGLISAATTAVFYTVFSVLLRVPLPHGVVERFF